NLRSNLEEANTRAVFALSLAASTTAIPVSLRRKARALLQKRIDRGISCASPRAIAHCIKSLCVLINKKIQLENIDLEKALRTQADHLVKLHETVSDTDWQWYEPYLTYSNGVMPEAMMMAYATTGDKKYLGVGRRTLDFLIGKSFIKDVFMPIGQAGWYHQNGRRYKYDQQPEEVRAIVYALKAGYEVTGDEKYHRLMRKAFYWFLGDNSLHQVVYDRSTGGCYDGVGRKNINLNQGAESTVSYLISRLAFD
ncbi:MAG: mannosyltransferase, partial [Dehalococcoidia bacterium]